MKVFAAFVVLIAVASANPLNIWTVEELDEALSNPATNPLLRPGLEYALNKLTVAIYSGATVEAIVVPTPVDIGVPTAPSSWTLAELSEALQDPSIDSAVVPYLEQGINDLMTALFSGNNVDSIIVYLPIEDTHIIPAPVIPVPEIPDFKPVPSLESGPLVQIIVNVNQVAAQEIEPTPVHVVDDIPEELLAQQRH